MTTRDEGKEVAFPWGGDYLRSEIAEVRHFSNLVW